MTGLRLPLGDTAHVAFPCAQLQALARAEPHILALRTCADMIARYEERGGRIQNPGVGLTATNLVPTTPGPSLQLTVLSWKLLDDAEDFKDDAPTTSTVVRQE